MTDRAALRGGVPPVGLWNTLSRYITLTASAALWEGMGKGPAPSFWYDDLREYEITLGRLFAGSHNHEGNAMSLESKIDALIKAIEANTAALGSVLSAAPQPAANAAPAAPATPAVDPLAMDETPPVVPPPTIQDVGKALAGMKDRDGVSARDRAIAVLKDLGAVDGAGNPSIKALAPERFAQAIEMAGA